MPNDMRNEPAADMTRVFEPFPPYEGESGWANLGRWLADKLRGLAGNADGQAAPAKPATPPAKRSAPACSGS
jgi:hypothetical protein